MAKLLSRGGMGGGFGGGFGSNLSGMVSPRPRVGMAPASPMAPARPMPSPDPSILAGFQRPTRPALDLSNLPPPSSLPAYSAPQTPRISPFQAPPQAASPRQVMSAVGSTSEPQIEEPPLPAYKDPVEKRKLDTKQLKKRINFGMRNAPMGRGGMGAVMGFMGLPFRSKGNGAAEGSGGQWMTVDPRNMTMYPGGFGGAGGGGGAGGNGGGGNGGGGDTPPTDPNAPPPLPGDKFGKNLIPEWWKEWYRTSGQYGGVPPVDGLL
jgi:hypothetical protein